MWLRKRGAVAPPAWAPSVYESRIHGQDLVARTGRQAPDWWCFQPPDSDWIDAGDGWQACLAENELPERRQTRFDEHDGGCWVRTPDGSEVPAVEVCDMRGRAWLAPMIMRPDGRPFLGLAFRLVDGAPRRCPTAYQTRLIQAAEYLRERVAESEDGRLACDLASVAIVLSAACHLSNEGLMCSGLLDDRLMSRIVLAAIGSPVEDA